MNLEEQPTEKLILQLKDCANSIELKHDIAGVLSKRGDYCILPALIEQIQDKKNEGYIGRFVFACESFDCSDYLEFFVDLVLYGSYEVSMTAEMVIESIESISDENKIDRALRELEGHYKKGAENEEYIWEAISFLRVRHTRETLDSHS